MAIEISYWCSNCFSLYSSAEDQVKSYPVAISPELVSRLEDALEQLDIRPMNSAVRPQSGEGDKSAEVSILVRWHYLFLE